MTREEQIRTLEEILLLEASVIQLSSDIDKIKHEKFRKAPTRPEEPKPYAPIYPVERLTPKIVAGITITLTVILFIYSKALYEGGVLSFSYIAVTIIGGFISLAILVPLYFALKKKYEAEWIRVEKDSNLRNEEIKQKYQKDLALYHELIKKYTNEKAEWEDIHNSKYKSVVNEYNSVLDSIDNLYNQTKIVPMQYRKLEVISYLYEYMSSSDADINQGLLSYDNHVQQKLTQSHIKEQQISNALADERNRIAQHQADLTLEQNLIAARQNELAEESNAIAERSRRDAKIAAAIATIQRHNISRKL